MAWLLRPAWRPRVVIALFLPLAGCAQPPKHGSLSSLSVASTRDFQRCTHQVPAEVCVRCRPDLAAKFQARGDWCSEHGVPESQCLTCHPELDFSPPLAPPPGGDVQQLASDGQDVAALEPHVVSGKITIFDFHARWCPPCRKVDTHVYRLLAQRRDIAVRKLDIASWDSPVAERWLGDVAELPYLVVFDKRGRKVATIAGAQLQELDRAIAEAGP